MSIAVDQTRLRTIVETLLPSGALGDTEARTMLQFVQVAAGGDDVDDPIEHSVMQSIAQKISALSGLRIGDVMPSSTMNDAQRRIEWLRRLGSKLTSREARELTYSFAFLTAVADLELTASERDLLEQFQAALGIDHVRATDLVVFLTETVAGEDRQSSRRDG